MAAPPPRLTGPPASMLHRPACLDGARAAGVPEGAVAAVDPAGDVVLLTRELRVLARSQGARVLPDAEPVMVELPLGGWAVAVLADPTQRYRNGVLGDEVEAGSVLLLTLPALEELARWRPPLPDVIEDRRATPWSSDDDAGLHVVVSGEGRGAELVTLAYRDGVLSVLALAGGVEREGGWLHVLGSAGTVVYAQHDPHALGPLVRVEVVAGAPVSVRLDGDGLGFASHVLGERNLDRAAHLPGAIADDDGELLALPRADQRAIAWVRCDAAACEEAAVTPLAAPLATNLAPVVDGGQLLGVLAAGTNGVVWWLPVPAGLGR